MGQVEGLPPIVDRLPELERIDGVLRGASRSEGRFLCLRGEAGIGKTRLLQEAMDRAERLGFSVGHAAALSESVTTYRPWTEALREVGLEGLLEDAPPPKLLAVVAFGKQGKVVATAEREGVNPTVFGPLHPRLAQLAGDAHRKRGDRGGEGVVVEAAGPHRLVLAPGPRPLGAILEGRESELFVEDLRQLAASVGGLSRQTTGDEVEPSLRAFLDSGKYEGIDYARDDAKLRQMRRFENVALGVARKASESPLLLVLDDLQWADPSSLALLRYVARNTRRSPVLLLGAYRMEEGGVRPHLQEALQGIASEDLLGEVDLAGLTRDHLRDLADVFLGAHALGDAFLDALWRETQGNPLFVREVLRGLEEDGAIALRAGSKRLLRPPESLSLPQRVRDVIQARIERLSKEDRELLEAAAACGTRFTAALLSRVAERDEAKVLRGLNTIARVHGLVRGAAGEYVFDHPAVHEAAAEATPAGPKKEYHLRAAAWLEIAGGRVDEIGEHYYLAGDPKAVPKLREAAEAARARYANAEAIRFYTEALSLQEIPERRIEILEALGSVCGLVGDYAAGLASYTRAQDLAKSGRDRARMAWRVADIQFRMGEYDAALESCIEALPIVEGQGVVEEGRLLGTIGNVQYERGDYDRALEYYGRSLDVCENIGFQRGIGALLGSIGNVYKDRGDYDRALEYYLRTLEMFEKAEDLDNLAITLNNIGLVHRHKGDFEQALKYHGRSLDIVEKIGDQDGIGRSLDNIGNVHGDRGDYDKALECYGRALAISEKTGNSGGIAEASTRLAETSIRKGDLSNAERHCERALSMTTQVGGKGNLGAAKRIRAMLLRRRGRWDESAADFDESLLICTQVGDPLDEGRTHHEFGLMWKDKGDRERAREHLSKAVRLFERIGAKKELERARQALRDLP
ncbi:MAG: hypothetical protein A2V88_04720 [Elusimicrobia bacterium RBG_16_66_12]|nr:MAG: hypothetical protein A2V88_04720 [Elusimicrobia bacterium RBG_16_66_12]